MASKLESALALIARGLPVFPVAGGAKAPPRLQNWPARASTDQATIKQWWSGPTYDENIGVHCADLIVLDVDPKDGGDKTITLLEDIHGLPETFTVSTPSGGQHRYFRGPNVSNSVGRLGPGIDVRSRGGYVVGPGSGVPAGDYRVAVDAPLAEAPRWLVDKLETAAELKPKEPPPVVPDATSELLQQARTWLAQQPKGDGAFATACGLRDLGCSEAQALGLMLEHDGRPLGVLQDKVHHAYVYAQNPPGAKALSAADFPSEPAAAKPTPKQTSPVRLLALAGAVSNGAGYVVKGLLQRGSYAILYGAPGEGKTFVAMSLAYHVAAGREWMGCKVRGGPVLYLPYEGLGGMAKRGAALVKHYGTEDVPLFTQGANFNLREVAGRKLLGESIGALGEKPVLIVIDTLARALQGGDENSSQDVGAFNDSVGALIASTGACVLVVHHSGKDKTKGARGSSALLGAVDTEIEVDSRQVTSTKQRDVELGAPIGFTLTPVALGMDEDGDMVTSCVVTPSAVTAAPERLRGNLARAWQVLCEMSPTNTPVSMQDWRAGCEEWLAKRRAALWDLRKQLEQKHLIEVDSDGLVKRKMR